MPVGGRDRQVGNFPLVAAAFRHVIGALLDGVLMGAGEGGEDQIAGVGRAFMDAHSGAFLIDGPGAFDVAEIQHRVDALAEHIQSDSDDIDVACALAVSEQGALDAVGSRQQRKLRVCDAGAAVVVRTYADNDRLAVVDMAAEVFDLIGKDIRGGELHGGGEVEDDGVLLVGADGFGDFVADGYGKFRFGAGEALGAVFKADVHAGGVHFVGQFADELGSVDGDLGDGVHILVENHLALERGGGIVEMHDHIFCAVDCLKGLADEVFSRLHQHLNGHVVGDEIALDECAENFVFCFAGGGEADFNLLEAHSHELAEHFDFFL